jgi:hypothetical protein
MEAKGAATKEAHTHNHTHVPTVTKPTAKDVPQPKQIQALLDAEAITEDVSYYSHYNY